MNQKRFVNIILAVTIILVATAGCRKASEPIPRPTPTETMPESLNTETEATITYLLDKNSRITGPPQPGSQEVITEPLTGIIQLTVTTPVPPNSVFFLRINEINFTSPTFTVQGDSGILHVSTLNPAPLFTARVQINAISIDLHGDEGSFSGMIARESVGFPNTFILLDVTGGQFVLQFSATADL